MTTTIPAPVLPARPPIRLSVGVFVAVFGLYAWVGDQQRRNLFQGMDLAIFHQGVRALSRGHLPWSDIKGDLLWGDHFHPAIAVFAQLYWMWDDPQVLVLGQAAALATAAVVVAVTAVEVLNPRWGWLMAASFALGPGVQAAATFDVHEVALGAPVLAMICRAVVLRRWPAVAIWCPLLLLVKEDAGTLVVGVALVCAVLGRRRLAAWLAAAGVAWTLVVTRWVIPALSVHGAWTYGSSVGSMGSLVGSSLRAWLLPWHLPLTVVVLVAAGGCVAVRSPLLLAALPTLLARGAYDNPALWGLGFHYNLLVQVVVAFATIDALRRHGLGRRTALRLVAAGLVLAAVVGPALRTALVPVDGTRWRQAVALTDTVPPGETVAVGSRLTPVAARGHVHTVLLTPDLLTPDPRTPGLAAADTVIVDRSVAWQADAVAALEARRYRVVRTEGDFLLLTRP